MAERLFGVETEYAITGLAKDASMNRESLVCRLLELAREELVQLPDLHGNGIYLQNGSRFYVDCGLHPEFSTPECANPWDVVRYIQAGERILERITGRLESGHRGSEIMCFCCNVDYGGGHATWGCHESYLHRAEPSLLPKQIIPHLVSRTIYTGAGGFNPRSPGLEFTLSPRVAYLAKVVSNDSTRERGIFHTKDESLSASGYHRLHLLCGESLCSELAAWLKMGATALVVAMIDAGLNPGSAVELRSPLDALRAVAADPECKAPLRLADGRCLTTLMIQRHYLEQAEAHLGDDFMPPWAEEVCCRWRAMLDQLQGAPESVRTTLDWAMKHTLYTDHASRRGVCLRPLPGWNEALAKLDAALGKIQQRHKAVSADFIVGPHSPILEDVARLTPYLRRHGLRWDGLEKEISLRREFFEMDTRFGQLGDKGIFRKLDSSGVLAHRVPGVDNIEHAMIHPPAVGRPRLRGEAIRCLAGKNGRCACDWQGVWDFSGKRLLDLSDPFASEEQWRKLPERGEGEQVGLMFSENVARLRLLLQSRG